MRVKFTLSSLFFVVVVCLLSNSSAQAQREYGFDNRKSSGQPYLKPEETVAKMKATEGFEVKLFAGEPQLVNPIAMTVDEKGRVWVVECFEYPKRTEKGKMPRDRIRILEDTDGDGVCDKSTIFIEGKDFPKSFDLASGIEVGHGGVYLGAPPYLFFIENKNDKPGKIEILLQGFGSQDTHETLNTFQWGPDGRLYGLHGVFTYSTVKTQADGPETRMNAAVWRYDPKRKHFEIFSEGTSNPWGMDWRNTDGEFILCCCVIPHLYHMVPGGNYKRQAGQSFNPYTYGEIKEICDHTFHKESGWAHAGLISLDTPIIPEKYRNSVIFGSIHGCSIKQNILSKNGSTYLAKRGDDFVVSGDKNFRPINLRWGPNGEIFCIDWHDQNPCHQAAPDSWDYERGRVYRIQPQGLKTQKPQDLGKLSLPELFKLLNDPNPYKARTALRLIHERRNEEQAYREPRPVLEPSWAKAYAYTNVQMADKPTEAQRVQNIRRWTDLIEGPKSQAFTNILNELKDSSVTIRREIASTAILAARRSIDTRGIVRELLKFSDDNKDPVVPQLVWLAFEGNLQTNLKEELDWLKTHTAGNALVAETIVPRMIRRVVAEGKPESLGLCLDFLNEVKDAQVQKIGLEALLIAIGPRLLDAPANWKTVQKSLEDNATPEVKRLLGSLAIKFRDVEAAKLAITLAADTKQPLNVRLNAIRDIGISQIPVGQTALLKLALEDASQAVQVEAVRALANYDSPEIPNRILNSWKELSPALRAEAVNLLASRKTSAKQLLEAVGKQTISRTDLTDNTVLKIQAFKDKELDGLIEKVWGRARPSPAELTNLINKMRAELAQAPGSFERGRKVFEANCAKCHKFDGIGAEVGPNIEGAGRDIEYILVNVLDPNRVIGAPYFIRVVSLLNGKVETGLLVEEDKQSITLKVENAVLKKIQKEEIDTIRVQEKSMMPEGLDKNMSVQDFRDLVRYVMADPFWTNVTVTVGKEQLTQKVGVSGRISLPETKEATPVTISGFVEAPADMELRFRVGIKEPFTLIVGEQGTQVVKDPGSGSDVFPDQREVKLKLSKGKNLIRIETKTQGKDQAIYARFHDPERKLRYGD